MNIIVPRSNSIAMQPRVRCFKCECSIGLRELTTVVAQSQAKKRCKVRQINFGNSVGNVCKVEVLCVAEKILYYSDGILAAHLPGLAIEPFVQFCTRNEMGLRKDCVQHSW